MGSIFIVTDGDYSDYHICAVFTEKSDADYYSEYLRPGSNVEEHDLNPHCGVISENLKGFSVEMTKEGDTIRIELCGVETAAAGGNYISISKSEYRKAFREFGMGREKTREKKWLDTLPLTGTFHMLARDEKHAVKIANERRTRWLAENLWKDDRDYYVSAYRRFYPSGREEISLADALRAVLAEEEKNSHD